MKAKIYITPMKAVLDPQGKAIENSLHHMGFDGVSSVRQGKLIELTINTTDKSEASLQIKAMCEKLLANLIVEDYSFTLEEK